MGSHDQIAVAVGDLHPAQFVALVQIDGDNAGFANMIVLADFRALDYAVLGNHAQVLALFAVRHPHHSADLLLVLQRQQVHHIHTLAGTGGGGDLVSLHLKHLALVGKEHNVVVGGAGKHGLGHIFLSAAHAHNAFATAVLCLISIYRLALHIPHGGQGEHAVLYRDQVLVIHIAGGSGNLGTPFVAEFVTDGASLFLYDLQHPGLAAENVLIIGNLDVQLAQLGADLFNFQSGQLTQTERHNGRSLWLVKVVLGHQFLLGLGLAALAAANGGDDLVHNINGAGQTL